MMYFHEVCLQPVLFKHVIMRLSLLYPIAVFLEIKKSLSAICNLFANSSFILNEDYDS